VLPNNITANILFFLIIHPIPIFIFGYAPKKKIQSVIFALFVKAHVAVGFAQDERSGV
jgi:hypothetical protein